MWPGLEYRDYAEDEILSFFPEYIVEGGDPDRELLSIDNTLFFS